MDLVSRLGDLGGLITDRTSLAYRLWCRPASRRACSTRTLGSDTIWKTDVKKTPKNTINNNFQLYHFISNPLCYHCFILWFPTYFFLETRLIINSVLMVKICTVWKSFVIAFVTQYCLISLPACIIFLLCMGYRVTQDETKHTYMAVYHQGNKGKRPLQAHNM